MNQFVFVIVLAAAFAVSQCKVDVSCVSKDPYCNPQAILLWSLQSSGAAGSLAGTRIFVSATTTNGGFGNATNADTICNMDVNRPNTSNYKALLADSVLRVACTTANCSGGVGEHTDWPLKSNTAYFRADGSTLIFTSNAEGIHNFSLPLVGNFSATVANTWTGLSADWTTDANNCADWTDGTAGANSTRGLTISTTSIAVAAAPAACNAVLNLYCVEQ